MNTSTTIQYTEDLNDISPKHLEGFFVGWKHKPSSEILLSAIQQSSFSILAMNEDKVIGFVTAISDGILSAYIPFLEVLPEYQHQGIGSELMKKMLTKLKGMYMIDLTCDEEMKRFYTRFGMKESAGMQVRNYGALNKLG